MSKNAVKRLQKLENDIKTVISIYEVGNIGEYEALERQKRHRLFVKPRLQRNKRRASMVEAFRKVGLCPQSVQSMDLSSIKKTPAKKKPQSAPSSSSTLSGIGESDYSFEFNFKAKAKTEISSTPKTELLDITNSSEWFDSESSPHEVFLTPSKTLEAAKIVLEKSNYHGSSNEQRLEDSESNHFTDSDNECKNKKWYQGKNCYTSEDKTQKLTKPKPVLGNEKRKNFDDSHEFPNHTQASQEKEVPNTSKSFSTSKALADSKNPSSDTISKRSAVSKSTSNAENQTVQNSESFSNKTLTKGTETKNKQSKKQSSENISRVNRADDAKTVQVKYGPTSNPRANTKPSGPKNSIGKQAKLELFKKEKQKHNPKMQAANVKTIETEENVELRPHELFKIIEKSNEKLEKMKVSKELALDIAKQLKNKYEEIQQSKEELIERLENVERDNERLSNEVNEVMNSKAKLQMKVEEFQRDPNTLLSEQNPHIKAIIEENEWLKNKMKEMEQQYKEDLLKQQKLIDQIQADRLTETKMEHKRRENQTEEEMQKLNNENFQLLAKIDELHTFLRERHLKVESLEGIVCELQEEVQIQRQHLKQKTERLEDTNKELESIRKNSEDLEDQVKTLRKNIENFDKVHQNLMKQTVDFEDQIKSDQKEIKLLQDDNFRLKNELENEKDSILIKNKIIEDQQGTIKHLREKTEEMKMVVKQNQSLERILNTEREEKLELQEALESLKARKEELKKKIKSLEEDLLLAPQEVVRDLQKTQVVLHELENQVQVKQKEWELHLQTLIKEKEQACSVAEFATKKLMQTTNEFQKQSEAHKKLHRVLAENLAKKERSRREAMEKANYAKYKVKDFYQDKRTSNQSTETHQCTSDDDAVTDSSDWYQRNITGCVDCQNRNPVQYT